LGHPTKFQLVSRLVSVIARHVVVGAGHQSNFAALNRGRHLCSAGRPSRWHWPTFLVLIDVTPLLVVIKSLLSIGGGYLA